MRGSLGETRAEGKGQRVQGERLSDHSGGGANAD